MSLTYEDELSLPRTLRKTEESFCPIPRGQKRVFSYQLVTWEGEGEKLERTEGGNSHCSNTSRIPSAHRGFSLFHPVWR